jgi:dTDP-4-amino-4,6-dideoxygalactose transaminase
MTEVPFHRASIGKEEIDEVVRTLESGWVTTGPRTAQFEKEFRDSIGAPYSQAVNSCTAGLHLALVSLGIGPGMQVITTPLTFCATVNVILHAGAEPVLADVGPDGNIDPTSVEARITARTRAIMPVHLSGLPCEMDALWAIAKKHDLRVIEDSAHATGSLYRGYPVGAGNPSNGHFSDAAVFSFYATKNMTTGEGGMVTTHDAGTADSLKTLCLHGVSKNAWNRYSDRGSWYYQVLRPGFKYNLSDIQSAIGIHQLRKLESFTAARQRLAKKYTEAFSAIEEFEVPPEKAHCRHSWHLYMLRLNLGRLNINRDEFIVQLKNRGVGTSVHFIPIPLHPFFAAYASRPENACPRALELYPRLISLPMYPSMTDSELEYVVWAAKDIAWRARQKKSVFLAQKPVKQSVPAQGPQL